jgi:hypothetical protein
MVLRRTHTHLLFRIGLYAMLSEEADVVLKFGSLCCISVGNILLVHSVNMRSGTLDQRKHVYAEQLCFLSSLECDGFPNPLEFGVVMFWNTLKVNAAVRRARSHWDAEAQMLAACCKWCTVREKKHFSKAGTKYVSCPTRNISSYSNCLLEEINSCGQTRMYIQEIGLRFKW